MLTTEIEKLRMSKIKDSTRERRAKMLGWRPVSIVCGYARAWIPPGGFHAEPLPKFTTLDEVRAIVARSNEEIQDDPDCLDEFE